MSTKSNASPSSFGWEFQSNCAIVLMLDNIREVISVRVEGATEDIELMLNNNKIKYIQAKSAVDSDNSTRAIKKMEDALQTLNEASKLDNVENVVYITNISNPFNNKSTTFYFQGKTILEYNNLPNKCKLKIEKIIIEKKYNYINLDKFEIQVLPFHGDGENRYKHIKQAIYEFLNKADISTTGSGQKIMKVWQNMFFVNSTQQDLSISITKKQLAWSVIVSLCEVNGDESFFSNYDDGEIEEIWEKYMDVINNQSESFDFATKIIYDFTNFSCDNPKDKPMIFADNFWFRYIEDFNIDSVDKQIKEAIIKLIIYKILIKRRRIASIKEVTNL